MSHYGMQNKSLHSNGTQLMLFCSRIQPELSSHRFILMKAQAYLTVTQMSITSSEEQNK